MVGPTELKVTIVGVTVGIDVDGVVVKLIEGSVVGLTELKSTIVGVTVGIDVGGVVVKLIEDSMVGCVV